MLYQALTLALYGASYMAIAYALAYFNKWASDVYARNQGYNIDYAIEEESNLAVAIRRFGLYLGIGIGMYGVISGPSAGYFMDMASIAAYGIFVSILFVGARVFNDMVVLSGIDNTDEVVSNKNVAVALVEAGGYLATGVIAMASVTGLGGGPATAIVFFLLGQVLLLAVSFIFEMTTRWDVKEEIRNGNPAAGLLLGGMMFATAVAIHGAIGIDFVNWSYNLGIVALDGGLAVGFMLILSVLIDRFFLPSTDLETEVVRDKNVAAVTVVTAMKIFGALMITAAVA